MEAIIALHQARTPRERAAIKSSIETKAAGWVGDSKCRGVNAELFMPGRNGKSDQAAAKAVCATCVVREPCLERAVMLKLPGVLGGMNEAERKRFKRQVIADSTAEQAASAEVQTDPSAASSTEEESVGWVAATLDELDADDDTGAPETIAPAPMLD